MEAALRGDVLLLQQAADLFEALVKAAAALVHRDAEAGELVRQEGAGETDLDAAVGDRVDHADLAGELQRIVEHRQHRAGDEPDGPRDRGGGAEEDQRVGAVAAIRMEVVLHRPHAGIAELLGVLRELQRLIPILRGRFLIRADRREELDAKFHRSPHRRGAQGERLLGQDVLGHLRTGADPDVLALAACSTIFVK